MKNSPLGSMKMQELPRKLPRRFKIFLSELLMIAQIH
nr:MAG TPA: hypothetical protein [Caudoviricetes sp.]